MKNYKIQNNFILIFVFTPLILILNTIFISIKCKKSSKLNDWYSNTNVFREIEERPKLNDLNFLDINDMNNLKKIELVG